MRTGSLIFSAPRTAGRSRSRSSSLSLEILGLLENLDAGDVQPRQNVVEFGAAADIAGQYFADLVVQDVALLLAHLYEPVKPPEFVVKRH
jgi:hypothetical protein